CRRLAGVDSSRFVCLSSRLRSYLRSFPTRRSSDLTAPAIPSVFTVTPNFKNAYAMTATLQVSRELSKNDALTFAYVNTCGRQLQWLHNINLINPLGFLLDSRPVFDPRVNAGTRANPAFNNVTIQDVGTSSSYNALEVNYERSEERRVGEECRWRCV